MSTRDPPKETTQMIDAEKNAKRQRTGSPYAGGARNIAAKSLSTSLSSDLVVKNVAVDEMNSVQFRQSDSTRCAHKVGSCRT